MTTELHKDHPTDKQDKRCHPHTKVYAAVNLDPCQEEWNVICVFLCKCDAIEFCTSEIQNAALCNRPLEWWRVAEYHLDHDNICWGTASR